MIDDARSIGFLGTRLYLYGLFISLGLLGYLLCLRLVSKKKGYPAVSTLYFGAWLLLLGLLFARLFYLLGNLGYFFNTINRPSAMLAFWQGGYSMVGALLGMMVAIYCFTKANKIPIGAWADVALTPLGLFLFIARGAEFFTLNIGRGKAVESGSWLEKAAFFTINDFEHLMPGVGGNLAVFRYEALGGLVLFVWALYFLFSKRIEAKGEKGDVGLLILSLFGIMQVIFESLRDDGHLLWGFIRISQVVSMLFPFGALVVFTHRMVKRARPKSKIIVAWTAALGGLGVGIYQEFQIDVTANLLKEYVIMVLAVTLVLWAVYWLWSQSGKRQVG